VFLSKRGCESWGLSHERDAVACLLFEGCDFGGPRFIDVSTSAA